MFRIGDAVIHPAEGICRVSEICEKDFGGKSAEYYVLESVYKGGATVYIPVEKVQSGSKIREVLSSDDVNRIIDCLKESEPVGYENDNQRRLKFKEILASGEISDMGRMLKTVHNLKNVRSGKKMKVSDERIIKETERSVFSEFAFSLGISEAEIEDYIENRIG